MGPIRNDRCLLAAIAMAVCLAFSVGCNSRPAPSGNPETQPAPQTRPQAPAQPASHEEGMQKQVPPEVEQQKNAQTEQARSTLNQDAITAVADTHKAIDAIAAGDKNKAMTNIEDATGKLNILLARNPADALIPVEVSVEAIDAAPEDDKAVKRLTSGVDGAVALRDFPTARVLLYDLMSELRVRTFNLPLATYPEALKDAARLLDAGKNNDASTELTNALNTLVVIDRVTPIPLILARAAVDAAQEKSQTDKNASETLVAVAKNELKRSVELGYITANTPEYTALDKQIDNLQKQLRGTGDTGSIFARLKADLESFLNKQSSREHR